MADYDNTNRGTLFTNDRKTTSKHPDYTGRINIAGKDYWLSGWLNESKQGKRYISLKRGELVEEKPASAPTGFLDTKKINGEPKEGAMLPDSKFDDDIPF